MTSMPSVALLLILSLISSITAQPPLPEEQPIITPAPQQPIWKVEDLVNVQPTADEEELPQLTPGDALGDEPRQEVTMAIDVEDPVEYPNPIVEGSGEGGEEEMTITSSTTRRPLRKVKHPSQAGVHTNAAPATFSMSPLIGAALLARVLY